MINKNIYIDLHLHLDGSLSKANCRKLAKACGIDCPDNDKDLENLLSCPISCQSLNEYLTKFDYPLSLLQTSENITNSIITLTTELQALGLVYVEIRFAPSLHLKNGLTQDDVIKAAIEGAKKAPIKTKLILCAMRSDNNEKENMETLALAHKYLGEYVVAMDLAGAEGLFKTYTFKNVFKKAKELNIPFTIHAGESDDSSSVIDALNFGASRIGHGVHSIENEELLKRLHNEDILLEICPTSETQTKAIPNMESLPLKIFDKYQIPYTICSDDMAVSTTNVKKEMDIIQKTFNYSDEKILNIIIDGLKHCYASNKEKEELIALVKKNFTL